MSSDTKRMFLAVILSGIVLFGWQVYFGPKEVIVPQESVSSSTQSVVSNIAPEAKSENINSLQQQIEESVFSITEKENSFSFSNSLAIKDIKSPQAVFDYSSILGDESSLKIQVEVDGKFSDVLFDMSYDSVKNIYTGKNLALESQVIISLSEDGKFKTQIFSIRPYKYRFVIQSSHKELENKQVRNFQWLTKDMDYSTVGKDSSTDGLFKWFGVDFNYHLAAVVFVDKQPSLLTTNEQGLLTLNINKPSNAIEYYVVFSKKNYDTLAGLGDNLKQSVDFGIFSILAVPILRGLQFIYKYVPNYGVGIILLTLLIRLLTFPLQYKSFKSMKKMQEVQPELTKLKEKFKDDPQRMQKETMELFKRAGANPLGGCLPLLLQLPFFFAIYKVLYSSVELVGAPFFGWIQDLSNKDPYYVFPVLMAISMFLQQKITPTATTDATQQKVMMFMPLIFGLIMKDLPSGLVLYIFVSTMFGIAQQFFVYKVTD